MDEAASLLGQLEDMMSSPFSARWPAVLPSLGGAGAPQQGGNDGTGIRNKRTAATAVAVEHTEDDSSVVSMTLRVTEKTTPTSLQSEEYETPVGAFTLTTNELPSSASTISKSGSNKKSKSYGTIAITSIKGTPIQCLGVIGGGSTFCTKERCDVGSHQNNKCL